MAIIQMYRGHYVQLAVDRRAVLITAVATKRGGQPVFFTTVERQTVELQGDPGLPGLDDARAAVLEALDSAQAQVVFDELQRVKARGAVKTPAPTRYETRHNA
jgi:hypothetical protein